MGPIAPVRECSIERASPRAPQMRHAPPMRVVLDTNVLISAMLKPDSVPDRALEAIWARGAVLLYDARVAAEYREVAGRPKFRAVPRARVERLLSAIFERGERVERPAAWEGAMGDEDDRAFVEVALAGSAAAIVTGNLKDFPADLDFEVLPPAELLARLEA